jgi:hypothetical protein
LPFPNRPLYGRLSPGSNRQSNRSSKETSK